MDLGWILDGSWMNGCWMYLGWILDERMLDVSRMKCESRKNLGWILDGSWMNLGWIWNGS